jgi:hypothetical protein
MLPDEWDWIGDKRLLKIWVNIPADKKLGDVKITDAVSFATTMIQGAGSKWSFIDGTQADHDIEIKIDNNLGPAGGALNMPHPDTPILLKDRRATKRQLLIDETPVEKYKWGSTGDTLDPTVVILHELLHKCRIKHQSKLRANATGNIADPSLPGFHDPILSDADKEDLKASGGETGSSSNGVPIKKDTQPAGPSNPAQKNMSIDDSSMLFPDGTFQSDVELGFSLIGGEETLPDQFDIPVIC